MSSSAQAIGHSHEGPPASGREARTWAVVAFTFATMVVELVAGYLTGSMALLADGWHMATHVGALAIAGFAYWYARRHASSRKFSFGTGKVYALAGFTNAILLAVAAVWIIAESSMRFWNPVAIDFDTALIVAVVGLAVNLICAAVLGHGHDHGHGHGHGHDHGRKQHEHHDHKHDDHEHHDHEHHDHEHGKANAPHTDHNFKSAYAHVLADALTSALAIGALLGGRFAGWEFLDPTMGIVGGLVILRWSTGLARQAGRSLLDVVPDEALADKIRANVQNPGDAEVADLHLWELGPGRYGCIVQVAAARPQAAAEYRRRILTDCEVEHLTVEVTEVSAT